MFDFAFSEIALIGVVALVVIGPERLPRVARTAGVVIGRLQRYAATVKADIAREVELSELKRVQGEIHEAARAFESGVRDSLATAESHFAAGQQALMTGPAPLPGAAEAAAAAGAPAAPVPAHGEGAVPVGLQSGLFSASEAPPGDSAEVAPAAPHGTPPTAPAHD